MRVREDDLPERLLLPRLREPPPEGLERRAHLDRLVRSQQECLDFVIAQRSQWWLLWLVDRWPLLHHLTVSRPNTLILLLEILLLGHLLLHGQISLRHAVSWELVLELLLHRIELGVEGIVHASVQT